MACAPADGGRVEEGIRGGPVKMMRNSKGNPMGEE